MNATERVGFSDGPSITTTVDRTPDAKPLERYFVFAMEPIRDFSAAAKRRWLSMPSKQPTRSMRKCTPGGAPRRPAFELPV